MGWMCRGWGWSAERIVGLDVVTADGEPIFCSESVNADLFWSARGSGPGFFAVVTRFHLETKEIPAGILASTYVWDLSEYDNIMPWVIETSRICDPLIEIVAIGLYADNAETAPPDQRPSLVVHLLTFSANVTDARNALRLWSSTVPRKEAAVVVIENDPSSIAKEVVDQYKQNPEKHRYCTDNAWIHTHLPTDQVVSVLKDSFLQLPTVKTFTLYYNMAPERPLADMALSLQTEHYLAVYCIWKHAKDDEKCQGWMRSIFSKMDESVSPGVYLGDSDLQVRKTPFLAPGKREILESHRKTWDPAGRFCSYLGLEKEF
jgi:FAD/FMN-containing dehydrogenase